MPQQLQDFIGDKVLLVSANDNKTILSYSQGWHTVGADIPTGIATNSRGITAVGVQGGVNLYLPSGGLGSTLHTGRLSIHELAFDKEDRLFIASASRSSVVEIGMYGEVTSTWQAPGVDESNDNRTHVNGLGLRDGSLRYVSALGLTNKPEGWREELSKGKGLVFDIADNNIVKQDLLMPHSPRWHDNELWLTESGRGKVWCGDRVFAQTEGFCRGLVITDDYIFVGISQGRITSIAELEIDRFAQPGIAVFNQNAQQVHFEPLDIREIMDIQIGKVVLQ